ncbi:MAG: 3-hydroxyacyl-CoA dehydrogenase family protein [Armatimonadetes bacterium]|nr:3-hydroxyacyl-CoA dehydrogenase family protein [Armatimonadota bacterium]
MGPDTMVAVVGAGTMGSGLAAFFAKCGCAVTLFDAAPEVRVVAKSRVADILHALARNGLLAQAGVRPALDRVCVVQELAAVCECGLVIESIPENLEWKRALFTVLDRQTSPDVVLATNTSSFSPAAISEGLVHPERVLATHFYYPAELLPLVEMVAGLSTAAWVMNDTGQFLAELGKSVIVCKDSVGYLGSRVQMALVLEAIRILEEGAASAVDIDNAVRASIGPRLAVMGPLETVDRAGLDVYLRASQSYFEAFGRDTFRPPQLLAERVMSGEFGIKSGLGLEGDTDRCDRLDRYDQLATLLKHMGATGAPSSLPPSASSALNGKARVWQGTVDPSAERRPTDE